jgi:hypothetical protein
VHPSSTAVVTSHCGIVTSGPVDAVFDGASGLRARKEFVYPDGWCYSFEAEVKLVELHKQRSGTPCHLVPCLALCSSLPAGNPTNVVRELLSQQDGLVKLGFCGLQQELVAGGFLDLSYAEQTQLLKRLGVALYRGDGASGVLCFFCDGMGSSCAACRHVVLSQSVQSRATDKASKLHALCQTASSEDVHCVFGRQAVATLTATELLYKVSSFCVFANHTF